MTEFRADLHCHSTCSDGTVTPEDLVNLAAEIGLGGLSITDHDTVEAYPRAIPAAQKSGIRLISGVEFSAVCNKSSVHILGYSFNLQDPGIQALCEAHILRREERNREMVQKLQSLGFKVSMDEVVAEAHGEGSVGRPHIAKVMMNKGYIRSIDDGFKRYLGEMGAAYVKGRTFSAEETIATIKGGGGFAVIAHPMLIKRPRVERHLLTLDFDGIESYYARIFPEEEQKWVRRAEEKGWLATGGSDFHGTVKPTIPLGCSWTPPATFDILYHRFLHNNPGTSYDA